MWKEDGWEMDSVSNGEIARFGSKEYEAELQTWSSKLAKEIRNLHQYNESLQNMAEKHDEEIMKMQNGLYRYLDRITDLENTKEALECEIRSLKAARTDEDLYLAEIADLRETNNRQQRSIDHLKDENVQLNDEIQSRDEQIAELNRNIRALESNLQSYSSEQQKAAAAAAVALEKQKSEQIARLERERQQMAAQKEALRKQVKKQKKQQEAAACLEVLGFLGF